MPNTILNPSVIAQASARILENELVMARQVFRGYEDEFDKRVNGYQVGDTISIRKPQQFSVRSGAVATIQDVTEGKLTLQVNLQRGVDFKFSGTELTLKIEELSERVLRPALVRLANEVDIQIMNLFPLIPNWVGEPATGADAVIDTFAKFARAAQRLDQMAAPQNDRSAVLAPDSWWALAGSQTTLFANGIVNPAYREGEIGTVGGVKTFMSQNVPTLALQNADSAATVTGNQSTTYASVANTEAVPGIMSLVTGGWPASGTVKAGTVFTIGSGATAVKAVNPVTKAVLPFQQQFTVTADATITTNAATLQITPPIIPVSGDAQWGTTDIQATAGAALNIVGDAAGSYRQNMMFCREAFALVMVPMIMPPGSVNGARESYKGTQVRMVPYYDGTNDVSNYRLDILFGVKVIDNRLAVRMTGGTSTVGDPSL